MQSPNSWVFVCQSGEIEVKSALLAASLRVELGDSPSLIAAVPVPADRWGQTDPKVTRLFDQMGVERCPVENPFGLEYPYANKVAALGAVTGSAVLLDSDMLCLAVPEDWPFDAPFNAKPADLGTWGENGRDWFGPYRLFGLDPPLRRTRTTVSGVLSLPYFNAGMVAVADAAVFGDCWMDTCRWIDREPSIENKRPWLDQIALPVALARLGWDYRSLGNGYNFPANQLPLPGKAPFLCHYHRPGVIRREPRLLDRVQSLAERYPVLGQVLSDAGDEWRGLLNPEPLSAATSVHPVGARFQGPRAAANPDAAMPELVITGIPRSGTSLLCRVLGDQPDCVIINEPTAIFGPLRNCSRPGWMACYYRDLRRAVLDGEAVENRVVDGRMVEDTRLQDVRGLHRHRVARSDFLLGTKNTLAYLSRIPVLRRALPAAPIVACVRNPIDSIASWKGSFAHLRDGNLARFPAGFVNPAFLSRRQQALLQTITETQSAVQRRALLWAYLADLVIEHLDSLLLLRYEDLTADIEAQTRRILEAFPEFGGVSVGRSDILPRSRSELLDDQDRRAIEDLCATQAERLGYDLFG